MWLVLFYVNSFFLLTVELILGYSLFQFILRFKMEISECGFYVYFNFFPNSQKENWKFVFVNVTLVGLSNFFQFMKSMKYRLLNVSWGYTSKFLSIHHRVGIFEFHLLSYFVRLWGYSFQLVMWVEEGEPICDLKIACFQEKKCSYLCNRFVSV